VLPSPLRQAAVLAWSGLVVVALAGCAGHHQAAAPAELVPEDATSGLFARGLYDIANYYLEPVSNRGLVLAGAQNLARLDRNIAVSETVDQTAATAIAFSYAGKAVASWPEPTPSDTDGWGRLAGALALDARAASPKLAALPESRIDEAVFDGIVGALDRFSRYSGPQAARANRDARDGFGGIGILLEDRGEPFRVAAVTPDGPADRAGVRPDDRIVAVDGVATAGRSEEAVSEQLRGPVASMVALTVARPGNPGDRDMRMQRTHVCVPTVTMTRAEGVVRLRIASFNRDTTHEVAERLAAARREPGAVKGIVLDLRGDPGGLLEQAVGVVDLFLSSGPIVATIGRHPASRQFFAATAATPAARVPLAVLVDGHSASAAEIVAAALQDAGRAVVIGSSSYGKGTVQTVLSLPNEGELTLTWARLVAPSGYLLHHHGVVPTVCTSDLGDDGAALAIALRRAAGADTPSPLTLRPRRSLGEADWVQLRRSCPPRRDNRPLDLETAERLLANPPLYAEAVHAIAAGPRIAGRAAPHRAALTAARAALFSGFPEPGGH
jgi:carboxyl-terminal processing protease